MTTQRTAPHAAAPRLNYPRKEAAYLAGISVRNLDYRIAMGTIKTRRIGSRILIPHEELMKFVSRDHDDLE
jgi:hypothetical protein